MSYTAWSVVFGEQPTAAKWNQLGANDAGFKDGTNIDAGALNNTHMAANSIYSSKVFNPYKFKAYRSSLQTPSAATFTKFQANIEEYDTGSNYDNATNYRFVAPVAGFYEFIARCSIGTAANGRLVQCFYKNGVLFSRGDDTSNSSNPIGVTIVDQIKLPQNEYV